MTKSARPLGKGRHSTGSPSFTGDRRARVAWFCAAAVLAILFTAIAFGQPTRPDPYATPQPLSISWWLYPIERNAPQRLPAATDQVRGLFGSPDVSRIGAVGDTGLILTSNDRGRTWVRRDSATTVNLHSGSFANANAGWIVGDAGTILATSDGGRTWRRQESGFGGFLLGVHFSSAATGWAVGAGGAILATRDGGRTWTSQKSGINSPLNRIQFVNESTGWTLAQSGELLTTADGGATWSLLERTGVSGERVGFHFIDSTTGWLVGAAGKILATKTGGRRWTQQDSGVSQPLYGVHFVSPTTGWVVGNVGTILKTVDGGATWRQQPSGVTRALNDVWFENSSRGWAAGEGGTLLATVDGGRSWISRTRARALRGSCVVQGQRSSSGWVVGSAGVIAATTDGGRSWNPQQSGIRIGLVSVFFLNPQLGWAVGDQESVFSTRDGGRTWRLAAAGDWRPLRSVFFATPERGWVTGGSGRVARTTDGGRTWRPANPRVAVPQALWFTSASTGWVAGRGNPPLAHTGDGGTAWKPAGGIRLSRSRYPDRMQLNSVHFVDPGFGWAAGNAGLILATTDGGKSWVQQANGVPEERNLRCVRFIDRRTGWAVGEGIVLRTTDGGNSWESQSSGVPPTTLISASFVSPRVGWATGDADTLLATTDGGRTWRDPRGSYSRWPAPWYYLSWLVVAALLVPAFWRIRAPTEEYFVEDTLVSDRPLRAGDFDALQFEVLALGLSRFLRNRRTEPPLTIAITGDWGTGKTSLMNLLRADLESYGFRPVWFNAWHHQQEEHLLASLLENVRAQAIPPWWRPEGVSFRLRLLWLRFGRHWPIAVLFLIPVALSVGYLASDPVNRLNEGATLVGRLLGGLTGKGTLPGPRQGGSFLALMLATLAPLYALWKNARAFGVRPGSLLASLSGSVSVRDLGAQVGFRHRFAREFQDVTAALNPRTMLILVDDLDRCQPQHVLTVLEAINFLSSSGDCFVVIGMARDRVERWIALGFKDLAEHLQDEPSPRVGIDGSGGDGKSAGPQGGEGLRRLARHYLEKLINIEVPVPAPTQEQSSKLLVDDRPPVEAPAWQTAAQRFFRRVLPAFLIVALLGGSFWLTYAAFKDRPAALQTTTAAAPPSQQPGAVSPGGPVQPSPDPSDLHDLGPRRPTQLVAGQNAEQRIATVLFALVVLIGLGAWALSVRGGVELRDSPEFVKALRTWHPLIFTQGHTPRSIKRFLNRIRYYAMRQRPQERRQALWSRLWARLRRTQAAAAEKPPIPEDLLVAFSAIEHCRPGWLKDQRAVRDFAGFLRNQPELKELGVDFTGFSEDVQPKHWRAFELLSTSIRDVGRDEEPSSAKSAAATPPRGC